MIILFVFTLTLVMLMLYGVYFYYCETYKYKIVTLDDKIYAMMRVSGEGDLLYKWKYFSLSHGTHTTSDITMAESSKDFYAAETRIKNLMDDARKRRELKKRKTLKTYKDNYFSRGE